ncbi:ribonuclease H-like domain-containing protein [Nemania abortiva]|nr:ribonuclease H-like domain-containing protein [Nemania abortiva]
MEGRYQCSDCARVFTSRRNRTIHAFGVGHMNNHSCIDCHTVFDTPKALKRHQALHKKRPPEGVMANSSTELQAHFSTEYWLEGQDTKAALQKRPNHGFKWASPALSNDIYKLLEAELHDDKRRELEYFPTVPDPSQPRPSVVSPGNGQDESLGKSLDQTLIPEKSLGKGPDRSPYKSSDKSPGKSMDGTLDPEKSPRKRRKSSGGRLAAQQAVSVYNKRLPPVTPENRGKVYAALVIDCEMVTLEDWSSDLVSVSAIDFMTGDIVLNNLVQPTARVRDWRSRVSGVDPAILQAAKADPKTTVLEGWQDAREKLFAMADANTIWLGHALPNDLKILRIAAERVVDSQILTAQAAFGKSVAKFYRNWGLKSGCKDLMGFAIQQPRVAHDALEDALATRELIIWCLAHPRELQEWGTQARIEYEKFEELMREKQQAEALRRAEEKKKLEAVTAQMGELSVKPA